MTDKPKDIRDRLIVVLPTNPALMGEETATLISALAIADLWQAVQERVTDPQHQDNQGYVFIDEADRLMHLPVSLSDALARSRSMHVSWFLAVQGWHQMPSEMQSAVKTNARTKLIFRAEDDDEAKTVARMAPELQPIDFMKLDKYQAYLKPVIDGVTRDWALVTTLPPTPPLQDPAEALAASRAACPPTSAVHPEPARVSLIGSGVRDEEAIAMIGVCSLATFAARPLDRPADCPATSPTIQQYPQRSAHSIPFLDGNHPCNRGDDGIPPLSRICIWPRSTQTSRGEEHAR